MRARPLAAVLVLAVASACGSAPDQSGPTGQPILSGVSGLPTPRPSSTGVLPSGAVPVDGTLASLLGESVDGLAWMAAPESDAIAAADPTVIANGEAVLTNLAVDPATNELVHVTLVRLRDGVFDDTFFRRWRDTFDEGACGQASGVAGHAEAQLGGRTTFIGTCAGGARTYHTWLAGERVLVSATAVGEERRLGEKLMAGLRE